MDYSSKPFIINSLVSFRPSRERPACDTATRRQTGTPPGIDRILDLCRLISMTQNRSSIGWSWGASGGDVRGGMAGAVAEGVCRARANCAIDNSRRMSRRRRTLGMKRGRGMRAVSPPKGEGSHRLAQVVPLRIHVVFLLRTPSDPQRLLTCNS